MQAPERPDVDADAPVLPGETALADIDSALLSADTLTIHFASFSDGRGLSLAVYLRQTLGFTGRLLASGQLLPDQHRELFAVGFDAVLHDGHERKVSGRESTDPIISCTYIHPASHSNAPSVWRQRHR